MATWRKARKGKARSSDGDIAQSRVSKGQCEILGNTCISPLDVWMPVGWRLQAQSRPSMCAPCMGARVLAVEALVLIRPASLTSLAAVTVAMHLGGAGTLAP